MTRRPRRVTEPELEGETQDLDREPSVGTSMRDPRTDARGRR